MRLAVPSNDDVSFSDLELLDDLLRYGSLKRIAKLRHVSESTLYCRLQDVFSRLDKSVERWEQIAQSDQTARLSQLEQELSAADALNAQLQAKVDKLAGYNRILTVAKAQELQINEQYRRMNNGKGSTHMIKISRPRSGTR